MRNPPHVILACLMVLALAGCTFHRTQSNHQLRELDPESIKIGESTWHDVLDKLGPPSGGTVEKIRAGTSMMAFHYACADQKSFNVVLAYLLSLPFKWTDKQMGFELIVEFDAKGVVADVYAVREHSVWRPFQARKDRDVTFYNEEVTP